ncbi:hypothetical protein L6164_014745 [Bauhinia variegata]|uniref:Uncharacterized protein n=1 Tax=Bauhinia variegata TaxID=167791 RepID=A0ACB9NK12_BAUVA|nr:hypothetical protein L6164_014745 [Bauhinia variegata]
MSSARRDHGIVRRMVSLPQSIMEGFSRATDDGMSFVGIGRRNQYVPSSFLVQPLLPPLPQDPDILPELF